MNILITGAAGFVGRNLTAALQCIKDGRDRTHPGLSIGELYLYDIDSPAQLLEEACRKADFVLNIAGMTRNQLVSWLKEYMDNISIKEYEEGLVAYNLISFSKDEVVLQKIYDRTRIQYKYFIIARNGEVIVYYSDKKTVFEHTGIRLDPMDVELQHILQKGIPVKDIEELYDFLAAITS